jgi:hypothetical protein
MTTPIFADERLVTPPAAPHHGDEGEAGGDRIRRLEDEVDTLRDTMTRFAEVVLGELKQIRHADPEVAPGAVLMPDTLPPTLDPAAGGRRPWLLTELFRDLLTILRMYLEPRYRLRRSTQLLVPLILGLFLANYVFFTYLFAIPVVSTILGKVGDIILAVLLYKVLSRETVRYREALIQYAAWQTARANQGHTRVIHSVGDGPTVAMDIER